MCTNYLQSLEIVCVIISYNSNENLIELYLLKKWCWDPCQLKHWGDQPPQLEELQGAPVHHSTEVSHEWESFSSIVFFGIFCDLFVVWNYVKSHWECKSLRCTSPWCFEVGTLMASSESLAGWASRGRWFGTKLSQSDPHAMLRCCLPPSRQDDKQEPEGTVQNHLFIAVKRLLDGHHMSSWINKVKICP